MAGRRVEIIIVLSRAGGLVLAVAAFTVFTLADQKFIANELMFDTLMEGGIPWGAYLLWIQVRWLCLGGEQPGNVKLWVLVAVDWVVSCLTIGTACAALTVHQFALQHDYCTEVASCLIYLVSAAMECAAGALTAVSALGVVWLLGSQPAQAP